METKKKIISNIIIQDVVALYSILMDPATAISGPRKMKGTIWNWHEFFFNLVFHLLAIIVVFVCCGIMVIVVVTVRTIGWWWSHLATVMVRS